MMIYLLQGHVEWIHDTILVFAREDVGIELGDDVSQLYGWRLKENEKRRF